MTPQQVLDVVEGTMDTTLTISAGRLTVGN
jgi:hypothetical protein